VDYGLVLKEIETAAQPLGVKLQSVNILSPKDIKTAFQDAAKGRADAVLFRVPGSILSPHRTEVAALAVKSRLPVVYESAEEAEEVDAGGAHVVRCERQRLVPARCYLRRQNP